MKTSELVFLIAIANFFLFLLLHILIFRAFRLANRIGILHCLALFFLMTTFLTTLWMRQELVATLPRFDFMDLVLLSSSLLCFFFLGGLFFYAAIEHSVRIRVSVELSAGLSDIAQKRLSLQDLIKHYEPERATSRRLEQLLAGGNIVKKDKGFQLTRKGLVFAKISSYGKRFFNIGLGG